MKTQSSYGIANLSEVETICKALNRLVDAGESHPRGGTLSKRIIRFEPKGYRFDASPRTGGSMVTVEWGIWPVWYYTSDSMRQEYSGPFLRIEEAEVFLSREDALH